MKTVSLVTKFFLFLFSILEIAGLLILTQVVTLQQAVGIKIANILLLHGITFSILGVILVGASALSLIISMVVIMNSIVKAMDANKAGAANPFQPASVPIQKKSSKKKEIIWFIRVALILASLGAIFSYLEGATTILSAGLGLGSFTLLGVFVEKIGGAMVSAFSFLRNLSWFEKIAKR
ncbi:MAG: hypothetical protein QXL94_00050 [Candidatus Parvarchaeum sp.]